MNSSLLVTRRNESVGRVAQIAGQLALAVLLLLVAGPVPAGAQMVPLDPGELKAWADAFFAAQLAELHIPGAVLVFIQDGEVRLAKGYGYADLEAQMPMDPEQTVVRIGSVSKLFVATAVMQLVEKGQLDLHADVNCYLDTFQLNNDDAGPVTLAHLLTHTGGFDDLYLAPVLDAAERQPLGPYLAEHMPPRILPPGEVINYSNHGYAVAGYIVEQVSGLPFDQYVVERILQPLGMDRSQYLLSASLPEGLAMGYAYQDGDYVPQPIDYDHDYPGGALVSTAGDMARFLLAHLQGGCVGDACILQPATVATMQAQQYTAHPELPGWTYGFQEGTEHGQHLVGHSGATTGFASYLLLLPEHDLGYFVAFNAECIGSSACDLIATLRTQFFDRFFSSKPALPPQAISATPPERLAGLYRYVRYHHTTVNKLWVLDRDLTVAPTEDGLGVGGKDYVEVAPLLFQEVGGEGRLAFRQDDRGRITYLFRPEAYERLAWYESGALHRLLFVGFGWLWAALAAAWPLLDFVRRRLGRTPMPLLARRAYWLVVASFVLNAAFLLSLNGLFWRSPGTMKALLVLPLVSAGLGVALLVVTGWLWRRRAQLFVVRLYYSLVGLTALFFAWFLDYWNLLGFHLG